MFIVSLESMKVFLIRHAKTKDAGVFLSQRTDTSIVVDDDTLQKIEKVKQKIEKVDLKYCSAMNRARQSADLIFGEDKYAVLDYIQEYGTPTELAGMPRTAANEFWGERFKLKKLDINWTPDGGESFASIAGRAKRLYLQLVCLKESGECESVAIVGHGTFFRHFLLCASGVPWLEYPQLVFDVLRLLDWDNLKVVEVEV